MNWRIVLIIAMILAYVAAAVQPAYSSSVAAADMYPAPYGYIFVFQKPIGHVVGVYVYGHYKQWEANTYKTSMLAYRSIIDGVLTSDRGRISIKATRINYEETTLAINVPGPNDVIVTTSNGYVYLSPYRILYGGYGPGDSAKDNDLIIAPKVINFNINKKITYVVPILRSDTTITVVDGNITKTIKVADLVGVDDTCIAIIKNPPKSFGWTGGLIPTPLCTKNVKGLLTKEYNGQPLYVAFSYKKRTITVIFVFAKPTPKVLQTLGLVTSITRNMFLHVIDATVDNYHVYFVQTGATKLEKVKVVNAVDSTTIIKDKRYCILPVGAKIVLALTWSPSNTTQKLLLPGEVIVYKADGNYYVCRGDMSFLHARVSFSMPKIKQFHDPIGVRGIAGTAVVLLGNGKVYYGTNFMIPYEEYNGNTIVAVTRNPYVVLVVAQSLFETPFFWMSVLLGVLFAALLLQKPKEAPRRVVLVWDIETPPPLEFPSKGDIISRVKQYIDSYGVCPNDIELAMRGILLPIKKGTKPTDEEIVCNFKTNPETEKILRNVVRILLMGFWAFKRRGRNYGFTYTLVGDTMLVAYLYKQENEKKPEELLLNAIDSAMKTYIGIPLHRKYAGLIIVAMPRMARKLRSELVELGVTTESGIVKDVAGYLSVKYPDLDENEKNKIIEFMKRLPVIIVVGDKYTPLIDYLGDIASSEYEAYLRRRGERL